MPYPAITSALIPFSLYNRDLLGGVTRGRLYIAWFRPVGEGSSSTWTLYFCEEDRIDEEQGWEWQLRPRRNGLHYWGTPKNLSPVELCSSMYLLGLVCLGHFFDPIPGVVGRTPYHEYIKAIVRTLNGLGGQSRGCECGRTYGDLAQVLGGLQGAKVIDTLYVDLPKKVLMFGVFVRDLYLARRAAGIEFSPVVDVQVFWSRC